MKQRGTREIIYSLFLVCGSLLVSGLALEVGLRVLGHGGQPQAAMSNVYKIDDPVLDWRYVPRSEYREGDVGYHFNSAGFRDAERSVKKPPGIKRLVVLGDSVTVGLGVRWETAFSSYVQGRLGREFEVVTIAQGGLNTPQEVHLLERSGLVYEPDVLVVNFVLNDCDFYSELEGAGDYVAGVNSRIGLLFNMPVDPRLKQMLKSSALIYFVKSRLENVKGRISGREYTDHYTRIWAQEENRRKVTRGFDRLAESQKEHRFEVVVIVWPLITDYPRYGFASIHEWVSQEAEKRGFSSIDLLPAFSGESYRNLQVTAEDNVHPNALGHRIAAERFVAWFRPNGA